MGLFGNSDPIPVSLGPTQSFAPAIPAPKPKIDWGDKLAALGAILNPQSAGPYNARQEAKRQSDEQQSELSKQIALYNYKLQHPEAPNNDTVNDYNFWKQTLPPEQFNTWLQNKINPPQYRQGPDGNFYRIDTPTSALPSAPVGKLTPYVPGGAGGNASGTFP